VNPDNYRVHGQWLSGDEMIARSNALLDCGWLVPLPKWAKARHMARERAYRTPNNRGRPGWRERCEPSLLVA
jgi:hypothetical protein